MMPTSHWHNSILRNLDLRCYNVVLTQELKSLNHLRTLFFSIEKRSAVTMNGETYRMMRTNFLWPQLIWISTKKTLQTLISFDVRDSRWFLNVFRWNFQMKKKVYLYSSHVLFTFKNILFLLEYCLYHSLI